MSNPTAETPETQPDGSSGTQPESPESFDSEVAATYAVLATCWREPTDHLVSVLERGELTPLLGSLDEVDGRDLRSEYARLFIGPAGPPCPPYESVYRDGDGHDLGPVMGPATIAVDHWYRSFGLENAPEQADLPDHIATELEFCAHLASEGMDDRLEQFLDEHLRTWTTAFLDRVEVETREPFYASLAATTREVLQR